MRIFSFGGISYIVFRVVCGLISKHINESKGYSNGFFWGAFLGILGIVIIACKPNKNKQSAKAIESLKSLTELHNQGVLSDSEFEAKKADLITRI